MIRVPYHIGSSYDILRPVDGRIGQLAAGALADGGSELDLGNIPNVIRVQPGDLLYFISDENELSGNTDAEAVVNNSAAFEITDINGTQVQLGSTFSSEPNSSSGKFFEFKVVRPSPYRKFTFRRADQTIPAEPALFVNGALSSPTFTALGGGAFSLAWGTDSSLTFEPIGSDRWSCEMDIRMDGTIEVVIDDGAIELQLSNMNVLSDAPLALMGTDVDRFGPYMASSMRVLRKLLGDRYLRSNPTGTNIELLSVQSQLLKAVAGTTSEFLCEITDRGIGGPPNLEGSTIYFELRDCSTQEVVVFKPAEWLSTGLVRTILLPQEALAGTYYLVLECHRGGIPALVQRTNSILIRIAAS